MKALKLKNPPCESYQSHDYYAFGTQFHLDIFFRIIHDRASTHHIGAGLQDSLKGFRIINSKFHFPDNSDYFQIYYSGKYSD